MKPARDLTLPGQHNIFESNRPKTRTDIKLLEQIGGVAARRAEEKSFSVGGRPEVRQENKSLIPAKDEGLDPNATPFDASSEQFARANLTPDARRSRTERNNLGQLRALQRELDDLPNYNEVPEHQVDFVAEEFFATQRDYDSLVNQMATDRWGPNARYTPDSGDIIDMSSGRVLLRADDLQGIIRGGGDNLTSNPSRESRDFERAFGEPIDTPRQRSLGDRSSIDEILLDDDIPGLGQSVDDTGPVELPVETHMREVREQGGGLQDLDTNLPMSSSISIMQDEIELLQRQIQHNMTEGGRGSERQISVLETLLRRRQNALDDFERNVNEGFTAPSIERFNQQDVSNAADIMMARSPSPQGDEVAVDFIASNFDTATHGRNTETMIDYRQILRRIMDDPNISTRVSSSAEAHERTLTDYIIDSMDDEIPF